MGKDDPNERTLSRLLGSKQALGLSEVQSAPYRLHESEPQEAEPEEPLTSCINCGYDLRGQIVDKRPECGLHLASLYRDPTPWSSIRPSIPTWWRTSGAIWSWDRRTRIRTSLVPTTSKTRQFAVWSVLMAAVSLGE